MTSLRSRRRREAFYKRKQNRAVLRRLKHLALSAGLEEAVEKLENTMSVNTVKSDYLRKALTNPQKYPVYTVEGPDPAVSDWNDTTYNHRVKYARWGGAFGVVVKLSDSHGAGVLVRHYDPQVEVWYSESELLTVQDADERPKIPSPSDFNAERRRRTAPEAETYVKQILVYMDKYTDEIGDVYVNILPKGKRLDIPARVADLVRERFHDEGWDIDFPPPSVAGDRIRLRTRASRLVQRDMDGYDALEGNRG